MKKLCEKMILFYKRAISPSLGDKCIYTPTCSMYTLDAIKKYGVIIGIGKGIKRIIRCNPFAKGGFDPVRENIKGSARWTL